MRSLGLYPKGVGKPRVSATLCASRGGGEPKFQQAPKLPSPTASTLMPPTRSQSAQSCGGNQARIERACNEHFSRSVDDGDELSDGAATFLRADPWLTPPRRLPEAPPPAETPSKRRWRWIFPALRVIFLFVAAWLVWYIAGNWNRWTGAARLETTDDAYIAGDVTPLIGTGFGLYHQSRGQRLSSRAQGRSDRRSSIPPTMKRSSHSRRPIWRRRRRRSPISPTSATCSAP